MVAVQAVVLLPLTLAAADVLIAPHAMFLMHFFAGPRSAALRAHVEYFIEFLEPGVAMMVRELGLDEAPLRRGLEHLRSLPDRADASLTQVVYRAHGTAG